MKGKELFQSFLKYIAVPNLIMGSGNTYYNIFYRNKTEAAILRKTVEAERLKVEQLRIELSEIQGKLIDYQSQILAKAESAQKATEVKQVTELNSVWTKIVDTVRNYFKATDNAVNDIDKTVSSTKTENLSDESIEVLRKSMELLHKSEDSLKKSLEEGRNQVEKALETYYKNSGGSSGTTSNFISEFNWSIENYIPGIDMTDLAQSLAVTNFCAGIIILFSLSTIFSAFYGNKIIAYFELEKNFPYLAKIIQLRMKIQNYTIMLNIFLIILALVIQIIMNFLVLVN